MKKLIAFAATLLLTTAPAGAAVQIVENGILTGATGVDVGGVSYDVSFLDGTCASVFDGCDSQSDFAFATEASGILAAQALLDQVFLDSVLGQFDSNAALTRGCSGPVNCDVIIPFGFSPLNTNVVDGRVSSNFNSGPDSSSASYNLYRGAPGFDTTVSLGQVLGRFTLSSVAAVPEPSTWATMLMGFGAMGVALRRRRRFTNNLMQTA